MGAGDGVNVDVFIAWLVWAIECIVIWVPPVLCVLMFGAVLLGVSAAIDKYKHGRGDDA